MPGRILVVDDVDFNVKLLDTKLKQEYYQVLTATNGVEAIKVAKDQRPDLILMDIMMPEMNGFDATKIIKSDPDLAHIPIIMVTALNAQEDKVNGLKAGADDFLTKPINDKALMMRIKSLLRLKLMTDELTLRVQTSQQFGFQSIDLEKCSKLDGAKVLFVDDDELQYNKLRDKLVTVNVASVLVPNIERLMSGEDSEDYSLIIVSSMMLDEDGLRICSALRSMERFRHTPILMIVDESDEMSLARGLEIGVNDNLIAPIELNEFIARCATQIRRKNYQDQLKRNYLESLQQSVQDGLTGLFNRRYFETHIRNMIEKSSSRQLISLMMIDIDRFKLINDTYGHQAGDAVLKQVSEIVSNNLRLTDLCARYGGEEFVVILPATGIEIGRNVAERVRKSIEDTAFKIPVEPFEIKVTVSIGVSGIRDNDNLDSLLGRADQNLYKAKDFGRNCIIFD